MNLLNEDNVVHICMNIIGDIVLANLLFILCSIPIITIGPSLTALYHCMLRTVKGNNNGTVKTFFRAFKDNFIQSLLIWILFLFVLLILLLNIRFLSHTGNSMSKLFIYFSLAFAVLLTIEFLYVFPVISAFSGSIKNHMKNALLFAVMHFPSTLLIVVISLLPMYMTYQDLELMPLYAACWFFFGFGLTAYINSKLLYRMFKPYLGEEEDVNEDANFSIDVDKADGLIELQNPKDEK